ncbi:DUF1707 SHOCT-like domain-containing protein [Rhodococcus phenolicus]|uniref:DUF1707 SHOCT-like domain-containing protein n=1 Tax=Rhodococcus phenolicus TaxID=263849 RepID=UPI000835C23A|nr:DUF1707 domain-containing protein [Rhodococcus phenolicus]
MAEPHEIRIGTAERELAQRLLGEHFAAGRLTPAEFEERSGLVEAATTRGDLVVPFSDLPLAEPAPRRRRGQGLILGLLPLVLLAVFFVADRFDIGIWLPAAAAVAAAATAVLVVRVRPATAAPGSVALPPAYPRDEAAPESSVPRESRSRSAPSNTAVLDLLTLLPIGLVAAVSMVAIRFPIVMMISAVVLVAVVVKAYRIVTGGPGNDG